VGYHIELWTKKGFLLLLGSDLLIPSCKRLKEIVNYSQEVSIRDANWCWNLRKKGFWGGSCPE